MRPDSEPRGMKDVALFLVEMRVNGFLEDSSSIEPCVETSSQTDEVSNFRGISITILGPNLKLPRGEFWLLSYWINFLFELRKKLKKEGRKSIFTLFAVPESIEELIKFSWKLTWMMHSSVIIVF